MSKKKNLLVVVDFQNDFVDGSLGFDNANRLESVIESKILSYRKNGDDVVFTLDTHEEDYLETIEGRNLPIKHCIKGTNGWEIYGKIKNLVKDSVVFEKGGFGSDKLYQFLKENFYVSIEFVGLVSNICVVTNAILAKTASPKSEIIVNAKATDSYDKNIEEKTFDVLENLHIKVINREVI
ncbi:pyrazinamidase / nicotinamidase [Campylobacter blaseri]|uniref:nicotinamidase n=1 Tax=Campylobacter blaseri TaxID=2042961 RepID=A0A2P8R3Z1_9BACT|nr:isochorismatase family cysteine hydrolase [Campylobacter blaseri]PSM53216.1 N-carbamoylsarcosine amidohydrolase [Campylobacter blaseri]PSM54682.1 N-carbamoylsarcosine amidohydrolase [Campylobacter blaseri]QKF86838.1 pyrazinamidase / nicotinamidase [Campylobacter blaseri]